MSRRPLQRSLALHALAPLRTQKPQALAKDVQQTRRRRQHKTLWYALYFPQFTNLSALSPKHLARQQQIADTLGALSDTVSIASTDSFLFEVASSLNYFGGIKAIRARLNTLLAPLLKQWQLPPQFYHAASPTPAASLLMARAASNLLVYRKENLRAALGQLPLHSLALSPRKQRQLRNSGLYILRDIWRLPAAQVAQRFGYDFINHLEQCLGHIANPVPNYTSKPVFRQSLEWDYGIENKHALLPGIEDLLERLCEFLQMRELAAMQLRLAVLHEHHEATCMQIDLRQASRTHAHLLLLLETRLNANQMHAPCIGLRLELSHFVPFIGLDDTLDGIATVSNTDSDILALLEQLQARLGNTAVRNIHNRDEHGPEYAGQDAPFGDVQDTSTVPSTSAAARPCWLLAQPIKLRQEQGRLFYHGSLHLLRGPERIEAYWWSTQKLQRDYYVACNRRGMRLWIFHERMPIANAIEKAWFLHGIFS